MLTPREIQGRKYAILREIGASVLAGPSSKRSIHLLAALNLAIRKELRLECLATLLLTRPYAIRNRVWTGVICVVSWTGGQESTAALETLRVLPQKDHLYNSPLADCDRVAPTWTLLSGEILPIARKTFARPPFPSMHVRSRHLLKRFPSTPAIFGISHLEGGWGAEFRLICWARSLRYRGKCSSVHTRLASYSSWRRRCQLVVGTYTLRPALESLGIRMRCHQHIRRPEYPVVC